MKGPKALIVAPSGAGRGPAIRTRLLVAAGAILLTTLSACSDSNGDGGAPTGAAGPTGQVTPGQPSGTPGTLPSNVATALASPVPGATALSASEGLRKKVTYDDEITVKIAKVESATIEEQGPGVIQGQEITIFRLEFSNGSNEPLDLNGVRVSALYGSDETPAPPSYYGNLNDFFGVVAPGQSLAASYGFIVPPDQLSDVTVKVRFDETHSTAVFAGSLG